MTRFNTKNPSTKTVNKAGGYAFKMSPQMELVHAVLTTFLEDKYYESGSDRKDRIVHLIGLNKPQFVANLAIVARKEFHLRSVTTLLLGELAKTARGSSLVWETIVAATERVDDLTELTAYLGKPLPKQAKRGIRNAILKFDRYALAKYKGEGKGVSLVDLFNLVHPKAQHASEEQKQAWKDLMEGNLKSFDTWEVELAGAKNDDERKVALERLLAENKMGYMALLRNLNNIIKYGVNAPGIERAIQKLTNPEEVAKSKQLPFRYYTAYQNVSGNRQFSNAIAMAMDLAVKNTPVLTGRTLIAIDESGSMSGDPIQKAAIFGATLMKANPDADVIMFNDRAREFTSGSIAPVIDLAEKIIKSHSGGGTNTSSAFQWAAKKGVYDRIIVISDNESWQDSRWSGTGTNAALYAYNKVTGADPFVYAIDIQGYGTKDIEGGKVFHLTGWSDRLLDFIGRVEQGETLVKYIEGYNVKE